MKKLVGITFCIFLFLGIISCNNTTKDTTVTTVDTIKVDTVKIDTTKVDTAKVEVKK